MDWSNVCWTQLFVLFLSPVIQQFTVTVIEAHEKTANDFFLNLRQIYGMYVLLLNHISQSKIFCSNSKYVAWLAALDLMISWIIFLFSRVQ